jgi:hypothetical protein
MDGEQPVINPWQVRDLIIDEHERKLLKLSEAEWQEYLRKTLAACRILDLAAKAGTKIREIRAGLQKETERQKSFIYGGKVLFLLPLVVQGGVYFLGDKCYFAGLLFIIGVIATRQELSVKIGSLKSDIELYSVQLESLKKEFNEHFGGEVRASKLDEIIESWEGGGVELYKYLEFKALDRIQNCSQARYRERLERLVEEHKF